MIPLRTMHDRLLVRRIYATTTESGLLHIPQGAGPAQEWVGAQTQRGEFTAEGEVLAVGPGPECTERREIAGLEAARIEAWRTSARDMHATLQGLIDSLRATPAPSPDVQPGDRIFWPSWARKWEIRLDGEDLLQIQGEDVAAVERDGVIVPLRHRILVHHERTPEQIGSLFVPDASQKKTQWARVVAVGAGAILRDGRRVPIDVKVGARVLLHQHGETRITIRGADNIIMRIDDVLAVDETARVNVADDSSPIIATFASVADIARDYPNVANVPFTPGQ